MKRIESITSHLNDEPSSHSTETSIPLLPSKWNGWGYSDTFFELNKDQIVTLTGSAYPEAFPHSRTFPKFATWAKSSLGIDLLIPPTPPPQTPLSLPPPRPSNSLHNLIIFLKKNLIPYSILDSERLFNSHGQSLEEMIVVNTSNSAAAAESILLVDIVLKPNSHDQSLKIINYFHAHSTPKTPLGLIPFGGGTNVTNALQIPQSIYDSKVLIASINSSNLNKILWIDRNNLMAQVETGITGSELEQELKRNGLCFGHCPDSMEFSTLGGWISTSASGMKKNLYGNIEDLILNTTFISPSPTPITTTSPLQRTSSGPKSFFPLLLGSEGCLGFITKAIIKLSPLPVHQSHASVVFPNFNAGLSALKEISSHHQLPPASIRLVDNVQFQFAQALKPSVLPSFTNSLKEKGVKMYLEKYQKLNLNSIAAATILFEGESDQLKVKKVMNICKKYGGIAGDASSGKRGFFMTFMIAYLRDFALKFGFLSESFETFVNWSNLHELIKNVKQIIIRNCKAFGIEKQPFISCRISQIYSTGVCVYTYFGFLKEGRSLKEAGDIFHKIESEVREQGILKNGGSISHHHGVGKIRQEFLKFHENEEKILRLVKKQLDPKNIFCTGNLIFKS